MVSFKAICSHRAVFTPIKGVDYESLKLSELNILPTGDLVDLYEDDYQVMRQNMIYKESPDFQELVEEIGSFLS